MGRVGISRSSLMHYGSSTQLRGPLSFLRRDLLFENVYFCLIFIALARIVNHRISVDAALLTLDACDAKRQCSRNGLRSGVLGRQFHEMEVKATQHLEPYQLFDMDKVQGRALIAGCHFLPYFQVKVLLVHIANRGAKPLWAHPHGSIVSSQPYRCAQHSQPLSTHASLSQLYSNTDKCCIVRSLPKLVYLP